MFTHSQITHPDGSLVQFNLQASIDFILWLREEVRKSRAIRGIIA